MTLATLAFAGYETYEYTESAEFCGTACHPMDPEYVSYEHSAHSEVLCVECHIGPGASFFIKSKIDGMRQIYAVMVNSFSRPIKTPVHDLRPARDTCEDCHTPNLFKDNVIKNIVHYDNDEGNTPVQSTLILKMGGWQSSLGIAKGIHWHVTNPVYYIPADEQRQVILWVGVEKEDGTMDEYYARDMLAMANSGFVQEAMEHDELRLVDCVDCHNRIAHEIPPPERSVDEAISLGLISRDLPFIRARAVEILTPLYTSDVDAEEAIMGLLDFYRVGFPDVYENQRADLDAALEVIRSIYETTHFPEMNMNWETNPNNQRHTPTPGCFRCHDDKHVKLDKSGNEVETISVQCNLCHTVPIVGRGEDLLLESPVIVGEVPGDHVDFSWTIEHRSTPENDLQSCYQCHGQGFCNNGVCHNLDHPPDMLFTHAEEYRVQGDQVCYTCHQDVLCSRCHPGGIIENP
jgi:nitrate/TMAO reductase-like tetraheme cytochrome c subunit